MVSPAKSAIVRANFSTRWSARAEMCIWLIAERIKDCEMGPSLQILRFSVGWMSELELGVLCPGSPGHPYLYQTFLAGARRLQASLDCGGRFSKAIITELLVIPAGDFDMDIEPVQERPGDALLVPGHCGGGAGAGLEGIAVVSTGAGESAI